MFTEKKVMTRERGGSDYKERERCVFYSVKSDEEEEDDTDEEEEEDGDEEGEVLMIFYSVFSTQTFKGKVQKKRLCFNFVSRKSCASFTLKQDQNIKHPHQYITQGYLINH